MSNQFTFKLGVEDCVAGSAPITKQEVMDYIRLRLEAQSVIRVTMCMEDNSVLSVTKVESVDK